MLELASTIHLIGAAQGLFLGFIQISRRKNRYANRLFSILIILISLFMLHKYFMLSGMFILAHVLRFIDLPSVFLFGPLIYLYTRSMTSGIHSFRKNDIIHGIPCLLCFLSMIIANILRPFHSDAIQNIRQNPHGKFGFAIMIIVCASAIIGLIYTIASWRILKKYSHDIKEFFSDIKRLNLFWLRVLIGFWFIFFVVVNITPVMVFNKVIYKELFIFVPIFFVIIIYISTFFALRHPDLFRGSMILQFEKDGTMKSLCWSEAREKYKRHSLNETNGKMHLKRLVSYMKQEKPYLDENLSLKDLAEKLKIPPHHLSIVINLHLKQNFYNFINFYRVEEVKERFAVSIDNNASILAIAFESGFNSKSTFNSIFKKFTGITPSEYRKKIAASQWNSEIFSSDLASEDDSNRDQ